MSAVIEINTRKPITLPPPSPETSEKQILEQQDFVDNAVHRLIEDLTGKEMQWNIHITGAVRDAVAETLEFHGLIKADELYPYIQEDEAEADEDCEPANLKDAIAEMREQPLKTTCQFCAVVLIFLAIFVGLPLVFNSLGK